MIASLGAACARPMPERLCPPVDRQVYRAGMAKLAAAVNIVTSIGPEGRCGFTASAVCSVTDDPPTLLVCVNKASQSYAALTTSKVVCINTVAGPQEALSLAFAGGTKAMPERFAAAGWTTLVTGAPVLVSAAVSFDCRVTRITEVGTHDVLFCEVLAVQDGDEEGLVYFGRRFHRVSPDKTSAMAAQVPALNARTF